MPRSRRAFASAFAPIALGLVVAVSGCAGKNKAAGPRGKSKEEIEKGTIAAGTEAKKATLIDLANSDLANGRYISARKRAEEALALDPNNADAHAIIGVSHWRAGDYAASNESLRKALELDPKNFGAAVALARNLRAISAFDESLKVLEPAIAAENEGVASKQCKSLEDCVEVGYCHPVEKVCKATVQVETRQAQIWAYYVTLDVDKALATGEEVFLGASAEGNEATLEVIRSYTDFLRPFAGRTDLVTIEGESATVNDFGVDVYTSVKHAFALVNGEPSRVALNELQIETRVNAAAVEQLGLKSLAKIKMFGLGDEEVDVVLIPEVDFQGLKIKNIPAVVQDLSYFESGMPEVPSVMLGHQALHRLGTIAADFPNGKLTVAKAPATAPAGAVELPLLMLDQWYAHVPTTQVGIDGSEFRFWSWLGGVNPSGIAMTAKAYLKSGHLPRDIENPEDVDTGRKMVFVEQVLFGDQAIDGVGGLVFLDQPGDIGLDAIRDSNGFVGFEIGGYLNTPLLRSLEITYGLSQGKVWIKTPTAPAAK